MGTGMKAVFDTNILVDYLGGSEAARGELARYRVRLISIITSIELMVGARDAREEAAIRGLLSSFEILELSAEIAQEAIGYIQGATRNAAQLQAKRNAGFGLMHAGQHIL